MKDEIEKIIRSICRDLFHIDTEVELTRPDPKFGDFSTNIALKLSKQLNKPPREIAEMVSNIINNHKSKVIEKSELAGPGFINISLTAKALHENYQKAATLYKHNKSQLILVEFGDANPFKEMHIGHLYNSIEGDTIAKILEAGGAEVIRLSYHGDVGLQVAKCVWGIGVASDWKTENLEKVLDDQLIGYYYAKGSKAYGSDEASAVFIREINEHIYKRDDDLINTIYDHGVKASFEAFDEIFHDVQIKFDKRYLESQSSVVGKKIVDKNIGKVFEESNGAIVYKGEKVGLHTRVFINSLGLPTYETKDLGLVELKNQDYPNFTKSIIITANEQDAYFKVMLAALKEINPSLASKTVHLSHGFVTLTTGKMSSRTGEVYEAKKLISEIKELIAKQYPDSDIKNDIFLAATRYTFLKQRLGSNTVFDLKESVGLEGNSGPYIQYAHARACSILKKAEKSIPKDLKLDDISLQLQERYLAMKISEFPEIVERSANELMPHLICTYLFELSQEFNSFYESNRVINDPRMFTRLNLVEVYAEVLKKGLNLLNIPAPSHM